MKCPICKTKMDNVNGWLWECPACDHKPIIDGGRYREPRGGLSDHYNSRFARVEVSHK